MELEAHPPPTQKKLHLTLTIVKASGIHRPAFRTLHCCAAISVDGGQVQRTKIVKGTQDLVWDESLSLPVQEGSIVKIEIFRRAKFPVPHDELVGETTVTDFKESVGPIEETHNIYKPGRKSKTQGALTVHSLVVERKAEVDPGSSKLPSSLDPASSALSVARGSLNMLSNVDVGSNASRGLFAVVMERVQKLIILGGAVAEVCDFVN
ncbi:hypothetical protein C8R43DRAFT_494513 [Mycena crocata]|nr:hypothetical protein C8R43DRAFT_494513 [Mycena crocata]